MPIRIRGRSTPESESVSRTRSGGQPPSRAPAEAPAFGEQLATAERTYVRQDLDRLYRDVDEQGRRLVEHPTTEELRRYKEHVREFLAFVVKNGLKLRSSLSQRELHQIVERVDEELLGLADALLEQDRYLLDLGNKIGTINGMLLDLRA